MLSVRILSLTCIGSCLVAAWAAPASAQMYPGQNVTVNMRAGGVTTLLYPDGKYARNVPELLMPGEKPRAIVRLRRPGTYRPHPVSAAASKPTPAKEITASAAPARRPAPMRKSSSAPSSSAAASNYSALPVGSAAALIPEEVPTAASSTSTASSKRVASASPAPARASGMDAALSRQSAILFNPGTTELPAETFEAIRTLAGNLNRGLNNGASRVQLLAYGGAKGDKSSDARRLSLKRALVLRQILIEDGVSADRIDVRAMGGADSGPSDRVDVFLKS